MRTQMGSGWQRVRLRHAAVQFALRGWPIIPGASLVGRRFSCGPGCRTVGCHPGFAHDPGALAGPGRSALRDPRLVASVWRHTPHAILLATGVAFDVVEAPSWLVALAGRQTVPGPVALTPTGRWMFLVRPGAILRPELARLPDVVLHGEGSWIPAPPTRTPEGRLRWTTSPDEVEWHPPVGSVLQQWLVGGLPQPRGTAPVPAVAPA
jgi:Bifunctional DNA primase/polymerase, N-terminal